ncbi:hypothetical protein CFOL_v3_05449 [Cephalotus follicularis]|uniref:Exo_endo_phos domain-containing protein n=1 Tax=Cephalotus follicularis TaxID=3775 RepID=A0A1Q3B228_CEPFO|nr:hypothetical protein CFOL_v3_05449 [Cephalotus follicularis]
MFSGIYASPSSVIRKDLWTNIQMFASSHFLPWLLLGDFKEFMASNEKLGGAPVNEHRLNNFFNCINCLNLIDLGFVEPKFTWTNLQSAHKLIMERLDRAFGNNLLRFLFPNIVLNHLSHLSSDHFPITMNLLPVDVIPPKKFRFESMWLGHLDFFNVVYDFWDLFSNSPI